MVTAGGPSANSNTPPPPLAAKDTSVEESSVALFCGGRPAICLALSCRLIAPSQSVVTADVVMVPLLSSKLQLVEQVGDEIFRKDVFFSDGLKTLSHNSELAESFNFSPGEMRS